MKVLIVDNGSRHILKLLKLFPKKDRVVMKRRSIPKKLDDDLDLIVLSGGHSPSIHNHKKAYRREIDLIQRSGVPILGICLGFELLIVAFGGKLERLSNKEKGLKKIVFSRQGRLSAGVRSPFFAYEAHRWAAKKVPAGLTKVAVSGNGIEIVQSRARKMLGLQFHPEMTSKRSGAYRVIRNFIRSLAPESF